MILRALEEGNLLFHMFKSFVLDDVKVLEATHHPNSVPINCALASGRSGKDTLCMVCQEETNLPNV